MESFNIYNIAGLMNFGNTCFMNASIQLLLSASVLDLFLLSIDNNHKTENSPYTTTIKDYFTQNTTIIGPKAIHQRFKQLYKKYGGSSQEDSHEFLSYVLDDIYETVKKHSEENLRKLKKIMTITIQSKIHWNDNRDVDNTVLTEENMISVPIDSSCLSLHCCINLYKANNNPDASIEYSFINLPKYIFIHIKRWNFSGRITKNAMQIEIPLQTNMFNNIDLYTLRAFIVHIGNHNGGHYISFCSRKHSSGIKWYCCNDSHISEEHNIEEQVKNAYVLLYAKD